MDKGDGQYEKGDRGHKTESTVPVKLQKMGTTCGRQKPDDGQEDDRRNPPNPEPPAQFRLQDENQEEIQLGIPYWVVDGNNNQLYQETAL